MSPRSLAALALLVGACGGAPVDDEVAPGATASYVTDAGRARVDVKYPDAGIVRGVNRFRLRPAEGSGVTSLRATMLAHGHHVAGALSPDGDATIAEVELVMPGQWELSAGVRTGAGDDTLRFSFVVP
ncbi:MAG: hypothetical protein IT374_00675 [Polyangiaceae bacterium]|nr:hypothetical protein [Polyangiaceae bacterium]